MLYSFSNFYTREEIIHWIISLILDVFPYRGFIKTYCTHIITFCPEMPIPKLVLEIGVFVKHHECTFPFKYPMKLETLILAGILTTYVHGLALSDPR